MENFFLTGRLFDRWNRKFCDTNALGFLGVNAGTQSFKKNYSSRQNRPENVLKLWKVLFRCGLVVMSLQFHA